MPPLTVTASLNVTARLTMSPALRLPVPPAMPVPDAAMLTTVGATVSPVGVVVPPVGTALPPVTEIPEPAITFPLPAMDSVPLPWRFMYAVGSRAAAVVFVAATDGDDLAAVERARDADLLRAVGREGIGEEGRGAADPCTGAGIVLEAALLHQGDTGGRVDAGAIVLDEIGALYVHVARAVIEDQAGDAVLAEAAADPLQGVGRAAAAVGEARAARIVAVHPGIDHLARDVAQHVEADAARRARY